MAKGATISDTELFRQADAYREKYLSIKSYTLHLFVNDHSPAVGDTLASYTECTTLGYAPQTIPTAGWTTAVAVAHAVLINQTNPRRFVPNVDAVAVKVYGYFVTDEFGRFAWAEAFTNPQDFAPGSFLDVRAKYRYANCPNP